MEEKGCRRRASNGRKDLVRQEGNDELGKGGHERAQESSKQPNHQPGNCTVQMDVASDWSGPDCNLTVRARSDCALAQRFPMGFARSCSLCQPHLTPTSSLLSHITNVAAPLTGARLRGFYAHNIPTRPSPTIQQACEFPRSRPPAVFQALSVSSVRDSCLLDRETRVI